MRVFVTGATGFLGSHIAERLSNQGHTVVALARTSSNTKFLQSLPRVELANGSVENIDSIRDAIHNVDAVIHSAGLVKAKTEQEFFDVNATGTQNILTAIKERATPIQKFVLVSSLAVAGPSFTGKPVHIDAEPNPVTHYGRSKLAAEKIVLAEKDNIPSVIIRPPMIYGPRDQEALAFFKSIHIGFLPFLGDGKNTLSVVYASDCAEACIRAIHADVPSGSTYFVEDGKVYVWREMLREVETALNKRALVRFSIPFFVLRSAAYANEWISRISKKPVMLTRDKVNELSAPHWVCDASKTRTDLQWTPEVDWTSGTKITARWYKDNHWL